MIRPTERLSINDDLVAAEVVDGEAVIINLGNGMYYTMDGVGAEAWLLIETNHSTSEIAAVIAPRYGIDEEVVAGDVQAVVAELVAEGLVVVENGDAAAERVACELPPRVASYAKPTLTRYTDMSEVLALDPPLPALGGGGVRP